MAWEVRSKKREIFGFDIRVCHKNNKYTDPGRQNNVENLAYIYP